MLLAKDPQNTDKYYWTDHAKAKLKQYGLSASRVTRIMRYPERIEEAIVADCFAAMQTVGNKNKNEIWIMWQNIIKDKKLLSAKKKIISAWRYPGITQPGKQIPFPADTLEELQTLIK